MAFSSLLLKTTLLIHTIQLFSSDNLQCCAATSVPCITDDCETHPFCAETPKNHFYATCHDSCTCNFQLGECMHLSQNGTLEICSSLHHTGVSKESCFCAPRKKRYGLDSCQINTVAIPSSFDYNEYCMPCTLLPTQNESSPPGECSTLYNFQAPPAGTHGTYFHSCNEIDNCSEDLFCRSVTANGYYTFCDNRRSSNSLTNACFCAPLELSACTVFSPCPSGYSCVRPTKQANRICAPSAYLTRVEPPMQHFPTLSKTTLLILTSTELLFVVFKSIALTRTEKRWLGFALVCFIVETIIGFSLTLMQLFIIIDSRMEKNFPDLDTRILLGALLFVFTELCAAISECISVRRKIRRQEIDLSNYKHKYRFSLVRRVVTKWIAIGVTVLSSIFSNRFQFKFQFRSLNIIISSIIVIAACYGVFTLLCYRRYWTRIVISSVILLLCIITTAVFVLIRYHHGMFMVPSVDHYFYSCGSFLTSEPFIMFSFGFNIFLTALSAFRLDHYSEMKTISAEQVEFFEAAVIGTALPCVWLSLTACLEEVIIVFLVAGPQVAVIFFPVLFDYIKVLYSNLKLRWVIQTDRDINLDP